MRSRQLALGLLPLLGTWFFSACGGNGPATFGSGGGNLSVAVSATNTCGVAAQNSGIPSGPYRHVYIAISDVQASPNANATPGDGSFVDVTPGLKSSPKLVDLLGTPNQCAVATLASNLSLAANTYQQFRVMLAADGTTAAGGPCGAFANCVTLANDPANTPYDLQIGSEATQGIALGPDQIATGSFAATASQAQVLNLAFNSCASVVALTNNQFRLKPVVMAGDATGAPSVSGQLVDSSTSQPVPSGQFLVALEAPDSRLVDRVVLDARPDSQGQFNLCPVMGGTYDVVGSGLRTDTGASYAATVTLGVTAGANLGSVPMVAANPLPATPAGVLGSVNSSAPGAQPVAADVTISALQASGASVAATIPPIGGIASTTNVDTQSGTSCLSGTDCAQFEIAVPSASPVVGQFSSGGTQYVQSGAVPSFNIEGTAFAPLSGATPFCSPNYQFVSLTQPTPGGTVDITSTPLSFVGCQ
jgi:hypothetical protein